MRWAAILLLVCCGRPREGSVQLTLSASKQGTLGDELCGTFTLTPFSLSAAGVQTQAGAPWVVQSGSAPVLGCLDTQGGAADFRYLVTATGFFDCRTHAPVDAWPAAQTFTVDVDCRGGMDVSAHVTAQVSLEEPGTGGYVDISAGVAGDEVVVGCKQADLDAQGSLHFGQSALRPEGAARPQAWTGLSASLPLRQWSGVTFAPGQVDYYFTGVVQPGTGPISVVQSLVMQPCAATETAVQTRAPLCVTRVDAGVVSTAAQLADVVESVPGEGFLAAAIAGPHQLQLYFSAAGPGGQWDPLATATLLDLGEPTLLGLYPHPPGLTVLVQQGDALGFVPVARDAAGAWSAGAVQAFPGNAEAQAAAGLFTGPGCF